MARTQKIIELENKLLHTDSPLKKVDLLNRLCWDTRTSDAIKSLKYAEEALALGEKIQYPKGIAQAKTNVAFAKYISGGAEIETAFKLVNESIAIFESINDQQGLYSSQGILGIINWGLGNTEKAFVFMQQSLKIEPSPENLMWKAWGTYTLGTFYLELKDFENALKFHKESIPIFEEAEELVGLAAAMIGVGVIYLAMGDYEEALSQHFEGLSLSKDFGLKNTEARALHEIGLVYDSLGHFDTAVDYLNQGLDIRLKTNNFQGIISSYLELGNIYLKYNHIEKALEYLHLAEKKASESKTNRKLIKIYQSLTQAYKTYKDPWKALEYIEKYLEIKSSIEGEDNSIQLKNLKSVFEIEQAQNEAEIHKLKNIELKQAYERIESQNKSIIDSIEYAKRIQEAILPPSQELEKYAEHSFIYYAPKDIVSGDFYWIEIVGEGETEMDMLNKKVILSAIDCTGHGVPGAFMVVMANSLLNEIIIENKVTNPAEILTRLDAKVIQALHQNLDQKSNSNDGMDLGLITLDFFKKELLFSGAKNSLYQVRDGQINEFHGSKFPIGSGQYKTKRFEQIHIPLQTNDVYYLATDGFQDQFGGSDHKKYMKKNFREFLLSISHLDMPDQKRRLDLEFNQWKGREEQTDDVLVIGMKVS